MKKETIFDVIMLIVIIITASIAIYFMLSFKELMNESTCYELPFNEFYQSERCEKYWKENKEMNN